MIVERTPYVLNPTSHKDLLENTETFVSDYMSAFDPSHDMAHINRVVALSRRLLKSSPVAVDPLLVNLTALLHDVGDRKYTHDAASTTPAADFLTSAGAPPGLADAVQLLVSNVSYSNETKNPQKVQEVLKVYPELGVVQDADRLDAIGAVGIARCFAFGAVKRPERGLEGSVGHFGEKLLRLEGMLKTEEGKRLGRERSRRVAEFERWWRDETLGVEETEKKWEVEDTYDSWENI